LGNQKRLAGLAFFACLFALLVIALGAFTRLMDAGLGCPDWPGCYGRMIPDAAHAWGHFVSYKAWAEMIHRYAVGVLSLLILSIIVFAISRKELRTRGNVIFSVVLILLLGYQITLGQWTVTKQLLPVIVSQHLLGGFFILATLWLVFLNNYLQSDELPFKGRNCLLIAAIVGLVLLLLQISLGAWTSTNYASLSCVDFPFCVNANPWMPMHFKEAFNLFAPVGVNYQGGVLSDVVRQTIQMTHRLGALVVTTYLFIFMMVAQKVLREKPALLRGLHILMGLLVVQLSLGMMNVLFKLPLHSAISHTVCAALLLITLLTFIVKLLKVKSS
jgi:cytochrome c oxidase assembly protein subunit 15